MAVIFDSRCKKCRRTVTFVYDDDHKNAHCQRCGGTEHDNGADGLPLAAFFCALVLVTLFFLRSNQ